MQQPGQAPQPGQAAPPGQSPMMPGMAPQQGAQTPSGVTGGLSKLPPEQLLAMYNNPQDTTPKLSVAGAYAQAVEQQRLMQMAAGQTAMAQNAQQQQQMPVVQELMSQPQQPEQPAQESPPVMAAFGGLMRGYAGGGAVAFRHGGGIQHFADGANEFGLMANPEADAMDALRVERAQKENQLRLEREQKEKQLKTLEETYYTLRMQNDPRAEQVKQQLDALSGRPTAPVAPAIPSVPMRMQDTRGGTPEMAQLAQMLSMGAPAPAPAPAGPRMQPAAVTVPTPPGMAIQGEMSPEERKTYADYRAMMEGRKVRPESLVKAEQGLGELAQANIAAQRAESERMAREAQERRDAAIGRSQRSILQDPQALLALAGGMSTERGKGIGSLASGAANLLGQREAAAEAARKEYATSQQAQRAMDAAIRQTQMLEAQRQVALESRNYDLVNQLDDKIAQSKLAEQNAARDVRNKSIEQARLERGLNIQERGVRAQELSAGRPNELELAMSRPEDYKRILAARAEAQQLRRSPEEVRAAAMERYADNWEKLDTLQKNDLAKQGITNFQQYVRMRDQMAGVGGAPTGGKTMSMADIQATASSSGKTPEEVRKAAIAAGYTIQ